MKPSRLFGALSVDGFLSKYWQKKPSSCGAHFPNSDRLSGSTEYVLASALEPVVAALTSRRGLDAAHLPAIRKQPDFLLLLVALSAEAFQRLERKDNSEGLLGPVESRKGSPPMGELPSLNGMSEPSCDDTPF